MILVSSDASAAASLLYLNNVIEALGGHKDHSTKHDYKDNGKGSKYPTSEVPDSTIHQRYGFGKKQTSTIGYADPSGNRIYLSRRPSIPKDSKYHQSPRIELKVRM